MALTKNTLTAVGEKVSLGLTGERNGVVGVQLPSGVAGTYVVEATYNGADFITLQMTNDNDKTTSTNLTVAGLYFAEYLGFVLVRVRKTVGVAAESIALSVTYG